MRSEKEMLDLIIGVAKREERIRGVYMTGSRTNPNAKKDIFQDYDFVYVVRETGSFIKDEGWIDVFGERLYMQLPEKMDKLLGKDCDTENCYGYLIQLADGNRVDFHLQTLTYSKKEIQEDRLCSVLLDKDGALPVLPPPSDEDHWVKKPSETDYICCCNEFWWLLNNVGKGLWRKEITYVMDMLNLHVRPQLMKLLSWYAGTGCNFSCSVGKSGKYLHRFLSQNEMERLLSTYPNRNIDGIWDAVFEMCGLFDELAKKTAVRLAYNYNAEEAYNSRLFLNCVYELPADAEEIFPVRRMREQDVEEAGRIWLETNIKTHSYIPEAFWMEHYETVKRRLSGAEAYVYENHKGIQGFAGITNGYLEGIFVKDGMRSQGVGHALIRICKSKFYKIGLHVYCLNNRAVNFYLKEGFIITKKQINEQTNQPEYEMFWRSE